MQEVLARKTVVDAGRRLVESGLIARTWGNVSCRVDQEAFVITPSGRPYETLKPEEVVRCRAEDCSYEGDRKPSSEKRLHALLYQRYPETNFVIHTHQKYASVLSASGLKKIKVQGNSLLGSEVRIAEYGLPGTARLRKEVQAVLEEASHAVIMAHHGAICFGRDYEETFACAVQLEEACSRYLKEEYVKRSKDERFDEERLCQFYAAGNSGLDMSLEMLPLVTRESHRTPIGFCYRGEESGEYSLTGTLPLETELHRRVYLKRPDIHYIRQALDPVLVALSQTGQELKPLLDDFAQLVGSGAKCAKSLEAVTVERALRGRYAVLLPGAGAICCAGTESDLQAVHMVMEKNAWAQIGSWLLGGGRYLSGFDSRLMNLVYKTSYAKKAKHS